MDMLLLIMAYTLMMLIADSFNKPQILEETSISITNNDLAVGDIVMFEVSGIKKSASNQTHQTVKGQVLSFGNERIEVDNFIRKNEFKARKDSHGQARRQYRFDQIIGGRNNIRIIYHA